MNGLRRCDTYIQWNVTQPSCKKKKKMNNATGNNMDAIRDSHTK